MGAHMSDRKIFLSETLRFLSDIELVAPEFASRQPKRVQYFLQNINSIHIAEVTNTKSPASLVDELRILCSDVPKERVHDLMPALNRYVNAINNIKLDSAEDMALQRAISLLRSDFSMANAGVENIAEPVIEFKDTSSSRSSRSRVFGRAAFRDSREIAVSGGTVSDASRKLQEPALRVRLSGDNVKGHSVERGAHCILSIDWGLLDDTTIVNLVGNELMRAREAKLEVVFVLYRGLFKVADNRTRIATRFKDDGFETSVTFSLTAPDTPTAKSDLNLEIEICGRPAVRIRISLTVVQDLSLASADAPATPVKIDLDKLIAGAKRPPPTAILRIDSTSAPSAELAVFDSGLVLSSKHDALTQMSIANQLGKIAKKMDDIAKDPVWNALTDPLKPTAVESPGLSEPLAKAASVGSELHEWLSMSAGMKDILSRIETLPIGSRIIVRSDGVAIPWETIYPERYRANQSDGNYVADVDPTKFWGYRFEFETILSPGKHDLPDGDTDRIEQHRNAVRKLTAVMNGDIDSENEWKAGRPVDYQLDAFNKVLANIQIKSTCPDVRKLVEKETTFGSFIYFYCHGGAERPFDPAVAEVLQINEQCRIEVGDVSYDATFADAPIVFLNSCSSGPLASVSFDSFCARFMYKGALGLITTSFSVPAPFAARFGCELILQYMSSKGTLGEILLDLRKKALDQHIPIGLFYMLRCPADISLNVD